MYKKNGRLTVSLLSLKAKSCERISEIISGDVGQTRGSKMINLINLYQEGVWDFKIRYWSISASQLYN